MSDGEGEKKKKDETEEEEKVEMPMELECCHVLPKKVGESVATVQLEEIGLIRMVSERGTKKVYKKFALRTPCLVELFAWMQIVSVSLQYFTPRSDTMRMRPISSSCTVATLSPTFPPFSGEAYLVPSASPPSSPPLFRPSPFSSLPLRHSHDHPVVRKVQKL